MNILRLLLPAILVILFFISVLFATCLVLLSRGTGIRQ